MTEDAEAEMKLTIVLTRDDFAHAHEYAGAAITMRRAELYSEF